jgi:hypothetical protein
MNRLAIAILATVAAFPAGYGTHAYLRRHDAGEDFRRGRAYGHNEVSVSYECGTEEFEKKFPLVKAKPKPPVPSYPAGGGQPKER